MNTYEPTVFIVDDDKGSRDSVQALVSTMEIATETFASAEEFLARYRGEPGCLVSDLRMPGRSAVELLETLQEQDQDLPTIVITGYAEISVTVEAMQRGAITLLEKPYREKELWDAIRTALQQNAASAEQKVECRKIRQRLNQLTPRECRVLELIVDGVPNKTIATTLGYSVRTVEGSRRSVFEKMRVDSVAQLVQDVIIANDGKRPVNSQPSEKNSRH